MHSLLKGLTVFAIIASLPVLAQDKDKLRINDQLLKSDDVLVPFNTSDAFKLILAGYKLELKELELDKNRTDEDKSARRKQIEERVGELLMLHEYIVNVTPIAFAVSLHFGAEIPLPITRRLIRVGVGGGQFTGGVTIAATKHRGTDRLAGLSIGGSIMTGANVQLIARTSDSAPKRAGATGIQWLTAVSIIVPLKEDVPSLRAGDLQGTYFGGGLELSTDLGSYAQTPGTISGGLYFKPHNTRTIEWPSAGMLFGYVAKGAHDQPVVPQAEALAFTMLRGTDGSDFRSPIPFVGNFSTSQHNPANREEAFRAAQPKELLDSVKRTQNRLKEISDAEKRAPKK